MTEVSDSASSKRNGLTDADAQAIAVECAAKYRNVALARNYPPHGFASVMVEVSDVFLPELLEGVDVSRVQLVPCGDELTLTFTTRDT